LNDKLFQHCSVKLSVHVGAKESTITEQKFKKTIDGDELHEVKIKPRLCENIVTDQPTKNEENEVGLG